MPTYEYKKTLNWTEETEIEAVKILDDNQFIEMRLDDDRCQDMFALWSDLIDYQQRNNKPRYLASHPIERIKLHAIIKDIDPYRSTITGERIRGRSHHRQHLAQHGYEEIGTDNIDEAKKDFHRPPEDDKQSRIDDAVRAYDHLASK